MFKITEDNVTGKWIVSPKSRSENGKWIIECETEEEAKACEADLITGNLKAPNHQPNAYGLPKPHLNGKTCIYPYAK